MRANVAGVPRKATATYTSEPQHHCKNQSEKSYSFPLPSCPDYGIIDTLSRDERQGSGVTWEKARRSGLELPRTHLQFQLHVRRRVEVEKSLGFLCRHHDGEARRWNCCLAASISGAPWTGPQQLIASSSLLVLTTLTQRTCKRHQKKNKIQS